MVCAGASGKPLGPEPLMLDHVWPEFVLFQTCPPPKVEIVAYTLVLLLGSNAIDATYFPAPAGLVQLDSAVALVDVVAVVSRQICPLSVPATKRSEFPGAIA